MDLAIFLVTLEVLPVLGMVTGACEDKKMMAVTKDSYPLHEKGCKVKKSAFCERWLTSTPPEKVGFFRVAIFKYLHIKEVSLNEH